MPVERFKHILLSDQKQIKSYTPRRLNMSLPSDNPVFDQNAHGLELQDAYTRALEVFESYYDRLGIDPSEVDKGVAVEYHFRSDAKIDVTLLENAQGSKIELLNVKLDDRGNPVSAIIYIPPTRKEYINKRVKAYTDPTKNRADGRPKDYKKFDKTQTFEAATIEKLWIDKAYIPSDRDQLLNWEVWLRAGKFEEFEIEARKFESVSVSRHKLVFPERDICSIHCSLKHLEKLFVITKAITGFRYLPILAGFFDSLSPREQRQLSDELLNRLVRAPSISTSVCVLDTGLFVNHPLLRNYIATNGVDSVDPSWMSSDHHGHGTQMAGLALVGDLTPILASTDTIQVNHFLESVKVFPPHGQNSDEHVGYITAQAVSRAEANNPDLNRVFCLSWSMEDENQKNGTQVTSGKPTSLSARLDQLAFGIEELNMWQIRDEQKRLLIVSAGNIREDYDPKQYLNINDLSEIEDPAQAWNVLTVGAITNKTFTNDPTFDQWSPLAGLSDLSPKSRTSVLWGDKSSWPTKPDIVMEGGNYLVNQTRDYMEPHPDTCPLTTDSRDIFTCSHDTSAANAQANHLAASLMAAYPDLWPESIRGLMVHSSEWVGEMKKSLRTKTDKISHLRRYGYGTPLPDNLLNSYSNRPCIIIQDYLQPFKMSDATSSSNIIFNDMNHYHLPWPTDELEQIYGEVQLRITLSYFIEPNPSERPPKTKYSYASHGLRFKLNRPNESETNFLARINEELRFEEYNEEVSERVQIGETETQDKWLLGPQSRDRGSLISDIWLGTGVELSQQNIVAVIPQIGWWKFRKAFPNRDSERYNERVRYSLILSLISTEEIDLYTPITLKAGIQIET